MERQLDSLRVTGFQGSCLLLRKLRSDMKVTEIGKIGIVGPGSVGLYYGGRLAAQGADVHFLM
jgi:hypothetical protein